MLTSPRASARLATLALGVLSALARTVHAGPYVAAEAGIVVWPETSNSNQLEADSAFGVVVGLAAGIEGRLGRLELELAHWVSNIHGFNHPDGCCRHSDGVCGTRLSGNGKRLHTTSVMVNLWPGMKLGRSLEVYAGGGVGGAHPWSRLTTKRSPRPGRSARGSCSRPRTTSPWTWGTGTSAHWTRPGTA